MKRLKYLMAFTIPLSVALSIGRNDGSTFLAMAYGFVFLPLVEVFLPVAAQNLSPELEGKLNHDRYFDWLLWAMVPVQYGLLFYFCSRFTSEEVNPLGKIGLVSAFGISCGVIGINVAHELGHRKSSFERFLARALLASSLNWQFYIEHNRGHHRDVGTPGDTETSMLNETVYAFWIRAIRDNLTSAFRRDPKEMILGLGIETALAGTIYFVFGSSALLGFISSALFGVLLLQSVNYIEHYGLTRKKIGPNSYEPIMPHHSWNSSHPLSRIFLFELSRHSDHHAHVTRKYPVLRHLEESPQMPAGYPAMILLAMVPPVWFKVMNPRVVESMRRFGDFYPRSLKRIA